MEQWEIKKRVFCSCCCLAEILVISGDDASATHLIKRYANEPQSLFRIDTHFIKASQIKSRHGSPVRGRWSESIKPKLKVAVEKGGEAKKCWKAELVQSFTGRRSSSLLSFPCPLNGHKDRDDETKECQSKQTKVHATRPAGQGRHKMGLNGEVGWEFRRCSTIQSLIEGGGGKRRNRRIEKSFQFNRRF